MHNIYSYHAKFNPKIPNDFIKKYSKENDWVLDPFCGCGTTLLEGLKLKRNVIGVDLSPIGILCAKVKTVPYDFKQIEKYAASLLEDTSDKVLIPDFPNKEIWFNPQTLHQLGLLNYRINAITEEKYRNLFLLLFYSIINNCARRRKTWNLGYLADNVMPNEDKLADVFKLYRQKIKALYKRTDFLTVVSTQAKCIEADIMHVPLQTVDLIVTSPPYPFAVDFIRYHRLVLYWMNKPVEKLSAQEVGARNKRSRKQATEDFFREMEAIFIFLMDRVKKNGYFCMTIGDTNRKKEKISFVDWTLDLFRRHGWVVEKKSYRYLKQQTMAQKRIKTENVLVLKKIK